MSGDRQPRVGDRVRWTSVVEGTVEYIDDKTIYIDGGGDDPGGNVNVLSLGGATVEVLEPADDPSKSLVGEVRQALDGSAVAKLSENVWWVFGWPVEAQSRLFDLDVRGCKVIGSVPGTPAAEQQASLTAHLTMPLAPALAAKIKADIERVRQDGRPPLSDYCKHLQHRIPEAACNYCSPEVAT